MQRTYYSAFENDGVPLGEELKSKKEALEVVQEEVNYLLCELEEESDVAYFEFYVEKIRETDKEIRVLAEYPVIVESGGTVRYKD